MRPPNTKKMSLKYLGKSVNLSGLSHPKDANLVDETQWNYYYYLLPHRLLIDDIIDVKRKKSPLNYQ